MTLADRRSHASRPHMCAAFAMSLFAACTPPAPSPAPPLPHSHGCPSYTPLRQFEDDTPLVGPSEGGGLPPDLAEAGRWKASRRTHNGYVALYVAEDLDGTRLSLVHFDAQFRQVGPSIVVVHYPDPNTWAIRHAHLAWWPGGTAVSWALSPIARHGATRNPQGFVAFLSESGRTMGATSIGPVHAAPVLTATASGVEVVHDDARHDGRRTMARLTCDRLLSGPPQ